MSPQTSPISSAGVLIRREIDRFISAARARSESDRQTRRRSRCRFHRSWPLLVSMPRGVKEVSAALHDASGMGIGFLCRQKFTVGRVILVKLFWADSQAIRVPAVVKHVSAYKHANLVGCEFITEDEAACQASLDTRSWFE